MYSCSMHAYMTPVYQDSHYTAQIKAHRHVFNSTDGHDKKRKASLRVFTAVTASSPLPISELGCSARTSDVKAWVADLRL